MKKDFSIWCGSLAVAFACAWSMAATAFGDEPFLTAWGMDSDGQASPTNSAVVCGGASAIAAGYFHSLAVVDSRVYAWGANGKEGRCNVPSAGRTNVVAVAAGREFSVALRNDGTLVSWGQFADDHPAPGKLTGDFTNDVKQVAAGERHALVLKNEGRVMATGDSARKSEWTVPGTELSDVVQVAAGEHFSLALKRDGTIVAWGNVDEDGGVLSVPASLQGHATKIAAGHYHALAITDTGDVVEWGCTTEHEIPDGARTGATEIAAGYDFSMAIAGGKVYVWGDGEEGQLDLPASLEAPAARIAAGWGHCLALGAGMSPHWLDSNVSGDAHVARAYSGYVSATGMPAVTYHKAGNWPSWLKLFPDTGVLSGTPKQTAKRTEFYVVASNAYGTVASQTFSIQVSDTPIDPPVFVTESVDPGEVGKPYHCPIVASNATSYYLNRAGEYPLPDGFSLASDGMLAGMPLSEDAGRRFFVVASNATAEVEKEFLIVIGPTAAAPEILTDSPLDDALVATPQSWEITTDRQAEFSLADVPAGLGIGIESISVTNCILAATPTAAGDYSFTVKAANSVGTTTKEFAISVNAAPAITTETLRGGSIGTAYSQTITATGRPAPTFTLASGSLPVGLSLGVDGTISGKPTTNGVFSFAVTASNPFGRDSRDFSITIASTQPPQFTSMTFSNKTVRLEWTTPNTKGTYLDWSTDLSNPDAWKTLGKRTSPWKGNQTNTPPVYYRLRIP